MKCLECYYCFWCDDVRFSSSDIVCGNPSSENYNKVFTLSEAYSLDCRDVQTEMETD